MNGIHEVTGSIPVWSTSFTSFSQRTQAAQWRGSRFAPASGIDPGLAYYNLASLGSVHYLTPSFRSGRLTFDPFASLGSVQPTYNH